MTYNNSSMQNSSTNDEIFLDDTCMTEPTQVPVFYILLLLLLVVSGVTANTIVISSFTKRKFRTPTHMLVVSLAAIDLIICLIQIPLTIVNVCLGFVNNTMCAIIGILGVLLFSLSVQVQCLILYSHVRIVTTSLLLKAQAVTWRRFGSYIAVFCVVGLFLSIFPTLKYGSIRQVAAVGYCFFSYNSPAITVSLGAIYTIQVILVIFFCCFFHVRLIKYVKIHSARGEIANQRHIVLYRLMMRKLLLWAACYSLLLVTRYIDSSLEWHHIVYQASYFLVWTNSVLNPLIQIFGKSTRSTYATYLCHFRTRVSPNVTRISVLTAK